MTLEAASVSLRRSASICVAALVVQGCSTPPPPPPPPAPDAVTHLTLPLTEFLRRRRLTVFTQPQTRQIERALVTADSIVADTTFRRLLTELDADGKIDWRARQDTNLPDDAGRGRAAWFLARFATDGNFPVNRINARRTNSDVTTAWTAPCVVDTRRCRLETDLNPYFLDQWVREGNPFALVNTLVHERVHAFGEVHGYGQTRPPNACDLAYVAGDLAMYLLKSRAAAAAVDPGRETLCPELVTRLRMLGALR
ncbi:MAG: hypothetical protein ACJ8J0_04410 [Longimicrobiaceae bacterium]